MHAIPIFLTPHILYMFISITQISFLIFGRFQHLKMHRVITPIFAYQLTYH